MRFRVKKGIHKEGKHVFKEGEVFESETDHVKHNGPEKFEQVSSVAKLSPKGTAEEKMAAFIPEQKAIEPHPEVQESLDTEAAVQAAKAAEAESDTEVDGDGEESDAEGSKLGKNVTEQFPMAEEADLLVFKEGKEYFVAESDAPDEAVETPHLKSKAAVEKYLKSKLKK